MLDRTDEYRITREINSDKCWRHIISFPFWPVSISSIFHLTCPISSFMSANYSPQRPEMELQWKMTGTQQRREREQKEEHKRKEQREKTQQDRIGGDMSPSLGQFPKWKKLKEVKRFWKQRHAKNAILMQTTGGIWRKFNVTLRKGGNTIIHNLCVGVCCRYCMVYCISVKNDNATTGLCRQIWHYCMLKVKHSGFCSFFVYSQLSHQYCLSPCVRGTWRCINVHIKLLLK